MLQLVAKACLLLYVKGKFALNCSPIKEVNPTHCLTCQRLVKQNASHARLHQILLLHRKPYSHPPPVTLREREDTRKRQRQGLLGVSKRWVFVVHSVGPVFQIPTQNRELPLIVHLTTCWTQTSSSFTLFCSLLFIANLCMPMGILVAIGARYSHTTSCFPCF